MAAGARDSIALVTRDGIGSLRGYFDSVCPLNAGFSLLTMLSDRREPDKHLRKLDVLH